MSIIKNIIEYESDKSGTATVTYMYQYNRVSYMKQFRSDYLLAVCVHEMCVERKTNLSMYIREGIRL